MAQQYYMKRFEQIASTMIGWFYGNQNLVTDQNIGAVARTILEASAIELEEIYQQLTAAISAAQPEGTYAAFGFQRRPARAASGTVTFTGTPASTITAGTIVATEATATEASIEFRTLADAVVSGGGTVDVTVQATIEGSIGNVDPAAIDRIISVIVGVTAVTNAAKFSNGRDPETSSERAERFARYIESLAQATEDAVKNAALSVDGIVGVSLIESPEATVLLYDDSGPTYSDKSEIASVPDTTTFDLVWSGMAAEDKVYFGAVQKFDAVRLQFLRPAASSHTGVWEYYDGDEAATLLSLDPEFGTFDMSFGTPPDNTLIVNANGLGNETATFSIGDFVDWTAATAAEIATVINQDMDNVVATVEGARVRITSKTSGVDSTLVVSAAGLAAGILGFTASAANNDASSWKLLTVIDQTEGFTSSGIVGFAIPAEWVDTEVDSIGRFWIRFRIVTAGASTTAQCNLVDLSPMPEQGVIIVAHNASGTLSAADKAAVESAVAPVRAKGIPFTVEAPSLVVVDVTYTVTPVTGVGKDAIIAKANAAIQTYFGNLKAGEVLRIERITQAILNAADPFIQDMNLVLPLADRTVAPSELIQLGTLSGS